MYFYIIDFLPVEVVPAVEDEGRGQVGQPSTPQTTLGAFRGFFIIELVYF